jgi:hypothetical protein
LLDLDQTLFGAFLVKETGGFLQVLILETDLVDWLVALDQLLLQLLEGALDLALALLHCTC